MGVPAFFRWLVNSSPQIIQQANFRQQIGSTLENPKIDNLYLDMNGIIHPCTHPQTNSGVPIPKNEEEMWINIRRYLDVLIQTVNPKRMIYFAIDGVAPKAKMNQQRSRRFRAAQEIVQNSQKKKDLANSLALNGFKVPESLVNHSHWDHNVITPGTDFMERVSDVLKAYIIDNLASNKLWKGLRVVFSDSGVEQEGEHKILSFIRSQRNLKEYDTEQKHCIYGADADLIMLGLSTHEPYFYIIREKMEPQQKFPLNEQQKQIDLGQNFVIQFTYVKIHILRQFLDNSMKDVRIRFEYDKERIFDDFVLLCFLVGNDFLPHIPGLDIRLGGIDILLAYYRKKLPEMNGYLTNEGDIDLFNFEDFLKDLGRCEFDLLRKVEEIQFEQDGNKPLIDQKENDTEIKNFEIDNNDDDFKIPNELLNDQRATSIFQAELERLNISITQEPDFIFDQSENYKQAYYSKKFKVQKNDYLNFIETLKNYYIQGIVWNFRYYYQGVASWSWFFPYYYSPLVSDLCNFSNENIQFNLEQPLKPLEQLLAVLPPYSSHALPPSLRTLMLDDESEIIDFYPIDFFVDLVGKRFAWLGEVILPFVNDQRLKAAIHKLEDSLNQQEKKRNSKSNELIFFEISKKNEIIHKKLNNFPSEKFESLQLIDAFFDQNSYKNLLALENNNLKIYSFKQLNTKTHICRPLPGSKIPPKEFYYTGKISGLIRTLVNIVLEYNSQNFVTYQQLI